MQTGNPAVRERTGYALFDDRLVLVDANAEIFGGSAPARADFPKMDLVAVIARILPYFERFDGVAVERTDQFARDVALRWRQGNVSPVEAQTIDGDWKLLSSHSRPDGGVALVSTDVTEMKRAQIAHQENAEIFRCITESHPLPVWVVDEDSKQILYESLDASTLLGRKWLPDELQYMTAHFIDPAEFRKIRSLVGKHEIVRDLEIQLKRANGSVVWCSANCRRGFYRGRRILVIGVLDITERKQREDLFGFLIKNHPLPVWMSDASTGEVIYRSDAAERLFGIEGEEGERKPLPVADHFVDRNEYLEIGRELMRDGIVENRDALLKAADGREFWATGNLNVVEFQGRRVVLAGIADITKRKKRDAEVALAREMLADAIESLSEGFALYDDDDSLVMCNRAYRALNQSVADMMEPGMKWLDMLRESARRGMYADAVGREDEWVNDRVRNRTKFQSRYEAELGDGTWHSVSMHQTDLGGFVVTRANISERKKAEAAEREATTLLQKVLDACPVPTRMSSIDGKTIYRNPASEALYGDRGELADFYADKHDRERLIDTLLKSGHVDDFRVRMHAADGSIFWGSISGRLIDFRGTQVIVSNTSNINDLIVAQEQSRQANDRLIDAIESLGEGFALYDRNDCLVLANNRYRKMHAISADVLVPGVNWFDFLRVAAERKQFPVAPEKMTEWLSERARDRREFRQQEFQHTDGGWFFVSNCPTREGGFVVTRLDITERKRAEQQIEVQRETLHQNEKLSALGGLLAGVAHELNNPLSVVLGQSLIMQETATDAKAAERATKIGKAAERCARIVKTFLAMARQQPARTSNVTVDEIIASALEVAGYSIRSSHIELSLELEPDLPSIWADPDQLSQVWINLLVNAEHALHDWEGQRKIVVSTRLHPDSGSVEVRVADTGPGIPKAILPRIFEPFFTTKDVGSGTGIGLSFCHRIVQSHGGTITVETGDGGGTVFVVTLPASGHVDGRAEIAVKEDTPKPAGLDCLVIDDEEEVGELIADVLRLDGFRVVVAGSGKEALRQLKNQSFALILSDLKMPNMDGRRLFNHISESHPAEVGKLAFLTGDTISPDAQVFLRATNRPYLEKPVKPAELRTFVSKLVSEVH